MKRFILLLCGSHLGSAHAADNLMARAASAPSLESTVSCGGFLVRQWIRSEDSAGENFYEMEVLDGSGKRLSLVKGTADFAGTTFSSDCAKLAYASGAEVTVLDIQSGKKQVLPVEEGESTARVLAWRPDGSLVVGTPSQDWRQTSLRVFSSLDSTPRQIAVDGYLQSIVFRKANQSTETYFARLVSGGSHAEPGRSELVKLNEGSPQKSEVLFAAKNERFLVKDLAINGDLVALGMFSAVGNDLDRETGLFSLAQGKVVKRLPDLAFPVALLGGSWMFLKPEGTTEEVPYLYDPQRDSLKRAPNYHAVGQLKDLRPDGKGGVTGVFNSPLIQGRIVHYDSLGKEKILEGGFDFSKGIDLSRHLIRARDGIDYPGYLFRPNGQSPKGAIVYLHGGSCEGNGFFPEYPEFEIAEAVRAGYSVLAISYAGDLMSTIGPPRYTKNYEWADCGKKEMDTIFRAREWLQKTYPDRPVFLWGHSQGAFLGNLAVSRYAEAAPWAGYISANGRWTTDMDASPYEDGSVERGMHDQTAVDSDLGQLFVSRQHASSELRGYDEKPPIVGIEAAREKMKALKARGEKVDYVRFRYPDALLQEIDAIQNVKKIKTPILLRHGKSDSSVSSQHAELFLKEASHHGLKVQTYMPAKGGHTVSKEKFPEWMEVMIGFLNAHSAAAAKSGGVTKEKLH